MATIQHLDVNFTEDRRMRPEDLDGRISIVGWQPIETAPKDGTEILAVWCGKLMLALWNTEANNWQEYSNGDFDTGGELTHWMPLPEPPKEIE
jgi:hypothetical protein